MTLEEAKRQIKELSDIQMELFDKTGDRKIYGEARAYEEAGHILDEVDTEPVANPDKLTLTELAHELRKILRFKYLAYGEMFYQGQYRNMLWLSNKPLDFTIKNISVEDIAEYVCGWEGEDMGFFSENSLPFKLDLSEYKSNDASSYYWKCIVEVE